MLELKMNEAKILRRQGKKITDIAQAIGRSERTVHYYLSCKTRARKKRQYPSKLDPYKSFIDSILEKTPDYNRVVMADSLKNAALTVSVSRMKTRSPHTIPSDTAAPSAKP